MSSNNFEVKYTIRIYDPALITELAGQYEKSQSKFKNKNEFFTHIIELGLKANRKETKTALKKDAAEGEENEMYGVFMEFYKYASKQFRKIYLDLSILQRLLCSNHQILIALNSDQRLFERKIKDGYYDDLPERLEKVIEELMVTYGLN